MSGRLVVACAISVLGCSGALGEELDSPPAEDAAADATDGAAPPVEDAPKEAAPAPDAPIDGKAWLHADLWSVWWNDRTRCGAERTFLEICKRRGTADCSLYAKAWESCDATKIVYGQVGPEKQSEPLCRQSKYPDVGGCVAAKYDFDLLRFYWYGAEWEGNWPIATLKVFDKGLDWKGGGELIALSNVPGAKQAAMAGIANHGLGHGCAMAGVTTGSDKYRKPFGGFAWVEVPTGRPVTVVGASATNFADRSFAGCDRGAATMSPWITGAPDAVLGCVYVQSDVVFEAGKHYVFRYGRVEVLPGVGPPKEIVAGFALPEVGIDVSSRDACKL